MKTTTLLSLLCSVALAEDQVPLKEKAAGWFDKAKAFIPSVTPSILNPVNAAASAFAASNVEHITKHNYKQLLVPKASGEEEWLVYLTGGNKTCFGRCAHVDKVFNESVPLLAALPRPAGSPPLHIGRIDCEVDNPLCNGWAAACPSIFHYDFAQVVPGQPQPRTPVKVIDLNVTTTTPTDIVRLARNAPNSKIDQINEYDGVLHPLDGFFAKFGLQEALGWAVYLMGTTPSWVIMIGISFLSRQFMSKRMTNKRPDIYAGQRPAGAAAPAPAPAAKPATPGSAGKGGKKRR